ncbi:hypothetical protein GCM10022381_37060 [Leifsonia kafniensis]|uniref:Uncharacterized protein n=1 Tax=Leifsonia kafniensis TaxID=475957 RepID=A0ABP7L2U6_9MICO
MRKVTFVNVMPDTRSCDCAQELNHPSGAAATAVTALDAGTVVAAEAGAAEAGALPSAKSPPTSARESAAEDICRKTE